MTRVPVAPEMSRWACGRCCRDVAELAARVMLHTMQRRQEWLRGSLIESDVEPLSFAGSTRLTDVHVPAGSREAA